MKKHLLANLWLLLFTLVICCVLYPAILWAIGQTVFSNSANGSLIEVNGKLVGSRLIAQPFTKDEFFWPRPSSASYNAAASGASNWGASSPQLRDRVAKAIVHLAKYKNGPKKGQLIAPDVEAWFAEKQLKAPDNKFDLWLQAHPQVELEEIPADMVMTSGSGLDPHITLQNALYQLDRVAAKRAEMTKRDPAQVRKELESLLHEKAVAPLGGMVGVKLVNVLEVNLELNNRYSAK